MDERIMIVDDEVILTMSLSELLIRNGFNVVGTAMDGETCIKKAAELKPDIILMDIMMPRKDGIEAMIEIKKTSPNTRFIMISAIQDIPLRLHILQATHFRFLLHHDTEIYFLSRL